MKKYILLLMAFTFIYFPCTLVKAGNSDWKSAVYYQSNDNGMNISINALDSYGISIGDRFSVLVLKASYSTLDDIVYAQGFTVTKLGEEYSFMFDFTSEHQPGEYIVKVTYSKDLKNYEETTYNLKNFDEALIAATVNNFASLTADNFSLSLEKAISDGIVDTSTLIKDVDIKTLGTYFVVARSGQKIFNNELTDIKTPDDIITYIKVASVLKTLQTGSPAEIKIVCKAYSFLLPNVFIRDVNFNNFVSIYESKAYSQMNELIENVQLNSALSLMKNASYATVENVIKDYAQILKVDLEYIRKNNISLSAVAKKIDNTIPKSYKDGLAEEIIDIVKTIKTEVISQGNGSGIVVAYPNVSINVDVTPNTKQEDKVIFNDIETVQWAKQEIEYLYQKGIINGVGEGQFEPDRNVKREEFIKMIFMAFPIKSGKDPMLDFSDCTINEWYYPYIEAACTNKIVQGSNGEFGLGQNLLRQDAAVICVNIIKYLNKTVKHADAKVFSDADTISNYATNSVNYISSIGVIKGFPDGTFMPHEGTTRAQAAIIIKCLMDIMGELV